MCAKAPILPGLTVIARIAQFAPKPGAEEIVMAALRSHRDFVAASSGCRKAYLGTPIHGRHLLLYSEWDDEASVNGLEASLRSDPRASGDFFAILGKLSSPPHVAQFNVDG